MGHREAPPTQSKVVTQPHVPKPLQDLSGEEIVRKASIMRTTTSVLTYLTSAYVREGFEWLLPIVFSKSTDPLWPDPGASVEKRLEVEVYGQVVRATLSMIIHKMVACSLACPKLFTLSPNIRIERRDRSRSGFHLYEFTQLDFEIRHATAEDVRRFTESVLRGLAASLRLKLTEDLRRLGTYDRLRALQGTFRVHDRKELEEEFGEDWASALATEISRPVWVTNIPREFYDFEDFEDGTWDNFDLFLPELGEVMSGSRREWEYSKMVAKMERDGVKKENYELLLRLAKEGRIKLSAGAGIGLERLVGWIVGVRHIGEVQPFPRVPGVVHDL